MCRVWLESGAVTLQRVVRDVWNHASASRCAYELANGDVEKRSGRIFFYEDITSTEELTMTETLCFGAEEVLGTLWS